MSSRTSLSTDNKGFTLLEMLLAISIFSLVSLTAWQILSSVSQAQSLQSKHAGRLQAMDLTFSLLKQDIRQFIDRGSRVNGALSIKSIFHGHLLDSDDQALVLVRAGWRNSEQRLPRSSLQRAYYRLKNGQLQRGYDQVLDKPGTENPQFRTLLSGVKQLKFHFFTNNQWQAELFEDLIPQAIAIKIKLENGNEIERRFLTVAAWEGADG